MVTDDLALRRLERMAEAAEHYEAQLLLLAAQRKLYLQANGKDPETTDVLLIWVHTAGIGPIDPYQVLSREEMAQVWEDAEDPNRQAY
jgi:hypothetical protein